MELCYVLLRIQETTITILGVSRKIEDLEDFLETYSTKENFSLLAYQRNVTTPSGGHSAVVFREICKGPATEFRIIPSKYLPQKNSALTIASLLEGDF